MHVSFMKNTYGPIKKDDKGNGFKRRAMIKMN